MGSEYLPVSTKIQSNVYWSVAIPTITFGCEVMEINDGIVENLENGHRYIARRIQKLPDQTPKPTILMLLGWCKIESVIDKLRMIFLWNLMLLDEENVFKRIVINGMRKYVQNGKNNGPISMLFNTVKKYDLLNTIMEYIDGNVLMSKAGWKRIVKCKIKEYEKSLYEIEFGLYSNLSFFKICIFD